MFRSILQKHVSQFQTHFVNALQLHYAASLRCFGAAADGSPSASSFDAWKTEALTWQPASNTCNQLPWGDAFHSQEWVKCKPRYILFFFSFGITTPSANLRWSWVFPLLRMAAHMSLGQIFYTLCWEELEKNLALLCGRPLRFPSAASLTCQIALEYFRIKILHFGHFSHIPCTFYYRIHWNVLQKTSTPLTYSH